MPVDQQLDYSRHLSRSMAAEVARVLDIADALAEGTTTDDLRQLSHQCDHQVPTISFVLE